MADTDAKAVALFKEGWEHDQAGRLEEAARCYRKSARLGCMVAQYSMATCLYTGKGVRKDLVEAAKFLAKAANQGYAPAQNNLGVCYDRGEGVSKNPARAAQLYHASAKQGWAAAEFNLGVCFRDGVGVQQNFEKAFTVFRKAAKQGHVNGRAELGAAYLLGHGVQQSLSKAYRWLHPLARAGDPIAQCNLGLCHLRGGPGTGVRYDVPCAVRHFRRAAAQGSRQAIVQINKILLSCPERALRRCSRPKCCEVKEPTVGERFRVCSGCAERHTRTYYCSEACQKADWRRHHRHDLCGLVV
jgi:TPR repeat protein